MRKFMEEIVRRLEKRRAFEKISAAINAARGALPKVSARKIVIVLCSVAALIIASGVMLNLKHVEVIEAGKTTYISTFNTEAAQILKKGGIATTPYDKIIFSGFENNQATIKVIPAFKVSVTADKKTTDVMIAQGTVSDALAIAKVTAGTEDIVSPSLTANVKKGDTILVKRVTYETKTTLKPISFATETQTTTLLRKGAQQQLCDGKNGQTAIITKIKYIDGTATQQQTISTTVSAKPVNRQLLVGTAASTPVSKLNGPSGLRLNANGVPTSYARCITGLATAYSARRGALTDSGRRAGVGYVAVNPNVIPYGSRLYIMSPDGSFVYGSAIAADTGTFVNDGSGIATDLYFSTYAESCRFGERTVNIYVLK